MKRLYPLLFISVLIYWGCEEVVEDTTPPTVSISSHSSGQSVNEIVTITVTTQDNEGISKVEFFIDDSLVLTDTESPYQYDWNTTQYDDNSEHIVKVVSYDNSDNSTESQPILLRVDNSTSFPQVLNITSVTFTLTEMTVEWEQSTDGDFKDYKVLYSESESSNKDTIQTYTDKTITSHVIIDFDPLVENWFWVEVTDTMGLSIIGTGMVNKPIIVDITIIFNDFLDSLGNQIDINFPDSLGIDVNIYWIHEDYSLDTIFTTYTPNHPYSNPDTSFYIYPGTTVIENVYTGNNIIRLMLTTPYGQVIIREAYWIIEDDCTVEIWAAGQNGDYYMDTNWGVCQ